MPSCPLKTYRKTVAPYTSLAQFFVISHSTVSREESVSLSPPLEALISYSRGLILCLP